MIVTNTFFELRQLDHRKAFQVMGWSWNVGVLCILMFVIDTALTDTETMPRQVSHSNSSFNPRAGEKCENDKLNECWNQLPPFPDQGIPSSPAGVAAACKAFETGMKCVNAWTKRCLGEEARKKITDSVRGAHEAFAFLCNDQKFREEFLSHSGCYKKISIYWDECANRFIHTLKSMNNASKNMTNLCCVRRTFKRCVSELAHYHCSKEASIFLLKMAETLVRTAMRGNTPQPEKCDSAPIVQECERRNESNSNSIFSSQYHYILLLCLIFLFVNRGSARPSLSL